MGLTAICLHKIKAPLAHGFQLGKLSLACLQTIGRPFAVAEKIGVFMLGRVSTKATLAYYVLRILHGKRRCQKQADQAVAELAAKGFSQEGLLAPDEVGPALAATKPAALRSRQGLRQYAGMVYVALLMEHQAIDSGLARRYRVPGGRFDAAACMKDFYASSKSHAFTRELRASLKQAAASAPDAGKAATAAAGAASAVAVTASSGSSSSGNGLANGAKPGQQTSVGELKFLLPQALDVWDDTLTRLRKDVVDLLFL